MNSIPFTESLNQLKRSLDSKNSIEADEWHSFTQIWQPYTARRKERMTSKDSVEKYLYFVLEGSQRICYFSETGKETTLIFTYPYSFGGVLDAFLLQQPSKYDYESLTASQFLRASHADFIHLLSEHPSLDQLIKQHIYGTLSGLLDRIVELQCYSAEEKFKRLLKRSPHILQIIPHKYLANYIRIDPTNFSKFLNTIKI